MFEAKSCMDSSTSTDDRSFNNFGIKLFANDFVNSLACCLSNSLFDPIIGGASRYEYGQLHSFLDDVSSLDE